MLAKLALRDAGIIAVALLLWAFHRGESPIGWLEPALSVVAGLGLGVCGYLVHEWAHFLAGRLAGSQMGITQSLASPSLFDFDPERNGRAQFVTMSLGGFAATAAAIATGLAWLPLESTAGRIAMGSLFFLAFLGVVLETPLLIYGLWAKGLPPVGTAQGAPPNATA